MKRKDTSDKNKDLPALRNSWDDLPKPVKYSAYTAIAVGVLWASKYLFKIMGDNIHAFKYFIRSIKSSNPKK